MKSPTANPVIAIAPTRGKEPAALRSFTVRPHETRLREAIDAANRAEIAAFEQTTGTRYLGRSGPVYTIADTLIRGLFVGNDGRHWGDGALLAESMNHGEDLREAYMQALGCTPDLPVSDLIIWTDTRGSWNGLVGPLDDIARALQLPAPVRALNAPWARGWQDFPNRTDRQELAWVAAGGKPTAAYRQTDW